MSKAPAFQLYAADFYMDTGAWTATEVGIYFRLLMHEWVNGALPNNNSSLARIAGIDPRNMQKMWSTVIAKKFTTDNAGMYVNERLEKTRAEQDKYRELQSEKGKRSAELRYKSHVTTVEPLLQPKGQPEGNSSSSSSISKEDILSGVKEIVDYLNIKTGKNFNYKTKSTAKHIHARLDENVTIDNFKTVIDNKCAKWINDPKMVDYLRPETLFGTKFEAYLNETAKHKAPKQVNDDTFIDCKSCGNRTYKQDLTDGICIKCENAANAGGL